MLLRQVLRSRVRPPARPKGRQIAGWAGFWVWGISGISGHDQLQPKLSHSYPHFQLRVNLQAGFRASGLRGKTRQKVSSAGNLTCSGPAHQDLSVSTSFMRNTTARARTHFEASPGLGFRVRVPIFFCFLCRLLFCLRTLRVGCSAFDRSLCRGGPPWVLGGSTRTVLIIHL